MLAFHRNCESSECKISSTLLKLNYLSLVGCLQPLWATPIINESKRGWKRKEITDIHVSFRTQVMAIFFHGNRVLKLCKWSKMMGIFIYFQLGTILKEYQGCSVTHLELNISQCCSLCSYFCTAFPLGRLPAKWKIHYGISVFTYIVCIDINDCYASSLPESVTHVNEWIDFCWDCIYNPYIATQLGISTNKRSYGKIQLCCSNIWRVNV